MTGLSRTEATLLEANAHLAQSIGDILTTPVGTRVMRREYGSDLPRLIDAPLNGETLIDVYAAVAEALDRWEPRLTLLRVVLADVSAGQLTLSIAAEADGNAIELSQTLAVTG